MAVPYRIASPYEQLMNAVEDTATQANAGYVHRRQSLVPCFRADENQVVFECYVFLEEWKWRPAGSSKRVGIVLHAQERMSKDGSKLLESIVKVSYFKLQGNNADVLHTIHFDYGPPRTGHPAFHAQLCGEPVVLPANEATELGCDVAFSNSRVACFGNARVPTSEMSLPSVLLCLAADHFSEDFFKVLRGKLEEIQPKMPQPDFDALKKSIKATPDHLRSVHWYAHV